MRAIPIDVIIRISVTLHHMQIVKTIVGRGKNKFIWSLLELSGKEAYDSWWSGSVALGASVLESVCSSGKTSGGQVRENEV